MNKEEIKRVYQKLIKRKNGCNYYKMDLHIHTPASKCYRRTLDTVENEYLKILETAVEKQLSIIVTTHFKCQRIAQVA